MILLSITVLAKGSEVGRKIGEPSPYKPGAAGQQQNQPPPPQQQQQPPPAKGLCCTVEVLVGIRYRVSTSIALL